MASFRLNIARIRGCPGPGELIEAMEGFGLPESEEFGVLNCSASGPSAFATLIRKTEQAVQRLDAEAREVTTAAIEKVTVYPFGVRPGSEVLEIYAGSAVGIEQVGLFLASCLALPVVVDPIEIDIASAIDKLSERTEKFQLRSIRVTEYAHNSFMSGPYAPKFLDSEHGRDFMAEYVDYISTASVRFMAPTGRVTVSLTSKACFTFSCSDEDQPFVHSILRKLA